MAVSETRAWVTETLRESFRQNGRAAALEAGLYRKPWGFDLAAVTMETSLTAGPPAGASVESMAAARRLDVCGLWQVNGVGGVAPA
jgi:hypothetical protein